MSGVPWGSWEMCEEGLGGEGSIEMTFTETELNKLLSFEGISCFYVYFPAPVKSHFSTDITTAEGKQSLLQWR